MTHTYTVRDVVTAALSKVGVDAVTTETKNVVDAHRNLNMLLGTWSADIDMCVNRTYPTIGYLSLDDVINLPPEYITALVYNLAILLAPDYDQPLDKAVIAIAQESVSNIKINNVRRQGGRIPTNGVLG